MPYQLSLSNILVSTPKKFSGVVERSVVARGENLSVKSTCAHAQDGRVMSFITWCSFYDT